MEPIHTVIFGYVILANQLLINRKRGRLKMTDKELLDWLENQQGAGLISDDAGNWAVSYVGSQTLPTDPPQDIGATFFVEKDEWHPTIRQAIEAGRLK